MAERLRLNWMAGEMSGPVFPAGLADLQAALEKRLWSRDELLAVCRGVEYCLGAVFPFTTPDGYRWQLGLKFRDHVGTTVYGEAVILIPKLNRHLILAVRLDRPLAVYAWGRTEEQLNRYVRDFAASLRRR